MHLYQFISSSKYTYVTLSHPTLYTDEEFIEIYNSALTEVKKAELRDSITREITRYLIKHKGFSRVKMAIKIYNDNGEDRLIEKEDILGKGLIDFA